MDSIRKPESNFFWDYQSSGSFLQEIIFTEEKGILTESRSRGLIFFSWIYDFLWGLFPYWPFSHFLSVWPVQLHSAFAHLWMYREQSFPPNLAIHLSHVFPNGLINHIPLLNLTQDFVQNVLVVPSGNQRERLRESSCEKSRCTSLFLASRYSCISFRRFRSQCSCSRKRALVSMACSNSSTSRFSRFLDRQID